eukprot:gene6669-7185_t
MSATILSNKQNDVEKFSEFKAKKLAQKEAQKEKLAAEFPLLFGKDAKARSTVGKYANKTIPTTPSKKKPLGNSTTTPLSKTIEDKMNSTTSNLSKKTPKKEQNVLAASAKKTAPTTKPQASVRVVENNENKTSNTNNNAVKQPQGKKAHKGFFHFLSSKPAVVEETTNEVTQESLRSRSKDLEDGIEIPTMNDFTPAMSNGDALLFSVVSEDSLQPQISAVESFPSRSVDEMNVIVPEVEKEEDNQLEMIIDEKVQDALDFMLESKELDATAHRRLSGQRFSAEVIRRFSLSNLPRFSNSVNVKSSISADIDFHAISRDISEEETMMLAKRAMAPLTVLNLNSNDSPVISEADYGSRMNSVMTNPMTTPAFPNEENLEMSAPEVTTGPDLTSSSDAINESNMDGVIGDLEVLYALRNYISSLDEMTFYNNPMRNPSYLKKRKSSVAMDPQVTIIGVEPALEEKEEHPAARSPKIQRVGETDSINANATCFEETTDNTASTAPEENQVESLMHGSHMDLVTPVSFLSSGIVDNRVILFPRQTLFDELLKLGLVYGEISSRIRSENHVKYVIDVQIFPVPAGVMKNHPHLLSSGVGSTRMMLLKRFTDFKEFRDQLILCQERNSEEENSDSNKMESEPIPSLPSKQSMSLGRDCSEEEYLNSRQRHLNIWLSSILARQSYESDLYRDTIYDFFNN